MAQTAEPTTSQYIELTAEEGRAEFERHAQELLGISGDEFVRRWNAGVYDDVADDGEHPEIIFLAMFGYGDK